MLKVESVQNEPKKMIKISRLFILRFTLEVGLFMKVTLAGLAEWMVDWLGSSYW